MKKTFIKFIIKYPKFIISILSIFFAGSIIANKLLSAPASIDDLKKRVEIIENFKIADFQENYNKNKEDISSKINNIQIIVARIDGTNTALLNEIKEIRADLRSKK